MKDETTVKPEEVLTDISVHLFDEIQLVSRFSGAHGAVVFARGQRGIVPVAPLRRLLVIVDDERDDQTADRVRRALGMHKD